MTIKDMVKDGKTATFSHYKDGDLWYVTDVEGYEFPVPISDIGDATFPRVEKCLFLMRYIRKYMVMLESAKQEQDSQTEVV